MGRRSWGGVFVGRRVRGEACPWGGLRGEACSWGGGLAHLADAGVSREYTDVATLVPIVKQEVSQRQPNEYTDSLRNKANSIQACGCASAPVSWGQSQLLTVHTFDPESTAYNEPVAVSADFTLAEPMARAALQAVVRRHAVLRTHYTLDAHAAARQL